MKKNKSIETIYYFAATVVVVILLNLIGSRYFFRIDLTEDNRFSITESSITVLQDLENVVYVEIFLDGEMPADFQRLKQAVKETLDEFKVYGGYNIQYEFRNPTAENDPKSRQEIFKQIYERGVNPTTLYVNEGNSKTEKIVFPGAVVNYLDKEIPINFIKQANMAGARAQINQSVEGLEYEFISAIRKVSTNAKKKIAFLQGHGELNPLEAQDIIASLSEYYDVRRVRLQSAANGEFEGIENLNSFDAIIMADPDSAFSDRDKFKLDQYIMQGGKALFFIDAMNANIDSMGPEGGAAISRDLNLNDLFFKMGIRLNPDLIQDQLSAYIPLIVGFAGDKPQYQMMKWWYYPILNQYNDHPISRNMTGVYSKFISTIDTVKATGIKKTPLVYTSAETRILTSPVRLDFNDVRMPPDPRLFNKGHLPVGYLLEGKFKSLYDGRVTSNTAQKFDYKSESPFTQVVVFSDGDIIKNDINSKNNQAYPLGYDKFSKTTFANKDLILNAVDYLLDDTGVIIARNKKIALRPLDINRANNQKTFWRFLNIGFPLFLIVLFGLIKNTLRKKKYSKTV